VGFTSFTVSAVSGENKSRCVRGWGVAQCRVLAYHRQGPGFHPQLWKKKKVNIFNLTFFPRSYLSGLFI
jgi:hypothetical protein